VNPGIIATIPKERIRARTCRGPNAAVSSAFLVLRFV
jgi:hypothetical protein